MKDMGPLGDPRTPGSAAFALRLMEEENARLRRENENLHAALNHWRREFDQLAAKRNPLSTEALYELMKALNTRALTDREHALCMPLTHVIQERRSADAQKGADHAG